MKRIAAILNSAARKGRSARELERAIAALEATPVGADVFVTDGPGIAGCVERRLAEGYDIIAAGGGDGTLNAVASKLAGTDAVMGVIPLGTLNHFAIDTGIGLDVERAAALLREGTTERIDVGEVNGSFFLNNSSVGIYPWMVRNRNRLERTTGMARWRAMLVTALSLYKGLPRLTVAMSQGGKEITRTTPFVLVGNNRYEMETLQAWKRAAFDEGVLTVAVLHNGGRFAFVKLAASALLGRLRVRDDFDVIGLSELRIDPPGETVDVALDGEVRMLFAPLRYRVLPKALKIILPPKQS